jgi:hypothetical protein
VEGYGQSCNSVLLFALQTSRQEKIMAVEEIKLIKRGGLRVYIHPASTDVPGEPGVFYSRRECGPYYRWSFGDESVRWRSLRVHPSALTVRTLCVASWAAVPSALQARLDEHYLE